MFLIQRMQLECTLLRTSIKIVLKYSYYYLVSRTYCCTVEEAQITDFSRFILGFCGRAKNTSECISAALGQPNCCYDGDVYE